MLHAQRWLVACLLTVLFSMGCAHERVYRCDDADLYAFSGRYNCGSCPPGGTCGAGCNLRAVRPMAMLKRKLTCGNGCGEVYWDEWVSDRPDRCDPCDECSGSYVGERCCPPGPVRNLGSLFLGGRNRVGNQCDSGMCSDGSCGEEVAEAYEEELSSQPAVEPYYPPATKTPSKAAPPAAPLPAPKSESADEPAEEPMSNAQPTPADEPPNLPELNRETSRRPRPVTRSASMRK
jgi:hypothetical protein